MAVRNIRPSYGDLIESKVSLAAPGNGDWVHIQGKLAVQITGAATAITALVERSTQNPAGTANPATVETITGNPNTGIEPKSYDEPGDAWWRVRVTALTGTPALVVLQGRKG